MKAPKGVPSGAELRALREQRERALTDPAAEAVRREASFLGNLGRAQADFEWIVDNQAWIVLGHESLAEWWSVKVRPIMSALSMRPTPEMATKVIAKVQAEEASLPRSLRRTKAQLAELVPTSEWVAQGRKDHRRTRSTSGVDLEGVVVEPSPLTAALTQAIQETETATEGGSTQPVDGVEDPVDLRSREAPAAGAAHGLETAPAVTPQDSPAGQPLTSDTSADIDSVAALDQPEIDHPGPGEVTEAGASPAAPVASAQPSAVDAAGAGSAVGAYTPTADHLGPLVEIIPRCLAAVEVLCHRDPFAVAALQDEDLFDQLLHASDDLTEWVHRVQQARIEHQLDRQSTSDIPQT